MTGIKTCPRCGAVGGLTESLCPGCLIQGAVQRGDLMVEVVQCPSTDQIETFLQFWLSESEMQSMALHILGCARCARVIAELTGQEITFPEQRESEAVASLLSWVRSRCARAPGAKPLSDTQEIGQEHPTSTVSTSEGESTSIFQLFSPPEEPDEIGRLGNYRVLRLLGQGGMGAVFQAEEINLKRMVALKVLNREMMENENARKRFLQEARVTASLDHENIVTIHQVGEENGIPYAALQLLKGESLADRILREKRLHWSEVVRIGRETAQGLSAAHAENLVHRDIKPSNLWLSTMSQGRVKILDFGLARMSRKGSDRISGVGTIIGTAAYMAPEQAKGQSIDLRCDLYSLGCVLYEMVTGQPPFRGDDSLSTILISLTEPPRPPIESVPNIPPLLSELILELLAKDPKDRPQTADVVAERLMKIEQKLSQASEQEPEPTQLQDRKVSRRWAGALLLLLLIGGGLLFGERALRFISNQGVLVVEIDDPTVQVRIKQNGLTLRDLDNDREFVLTARPGRIVVYEKNGIGPLVTKPFTLNRGGSTTVQISLAELKEGRKLNESLPENVED